MLKVVVKDVSNQTFVTRFNILKDTANISESYRFIWWAPQKSATRTAAQILSVYGCRHNKKPIFLSHTMTSCNYTSNCIIPEGYENYSLLISARNPYARTYSIFKNLYHNCFLKDKENFTKFLYDGINYSGLKEIVVNPPTPNREFIPIRTENIKEDFLNLTFTKEKLTEKQLDLILEPDKPATKWEKFYTKETKEIVFNLTKHQFEIFGYKK